MLVVLVSPLAQADGDGDALAAAQELVQAAGLPPWAALLILALVGLLGPLLKGWLEARGGFGYTVRGIEAYKALHPERAAEVDAVMRAAALVEGKGEKGAAAIKAAVQRERGDAAARASDGVSAAPPAKAAKAAKKKATAAADLIRKVADDLARARKSP